MGNVKETERLIAERIGKEWARYSYAELLKFLNTTQYIEIEEAGNVLR